MNHLNHDIESLIGTLLAGEQPPTDVDPALVQQITQLIKEAGSVNIDPAFKAHLLERIHQKRTASSPFWSAHWWKVAFPVFAVMVLGTAMYTFGPLSKVQPSDSFGQRPSTVKPGAITHKIKSSGGGMISSDDNPTLVQANTGSWSGSSPLESVKQLFKRESKPATPKKHYGGSPMIDISDNPTLVQSNTGAWEGESVRMAKDQAWIEPYPMPEPEPWIHIEPENREKYAQIETSPVKKVVEAPVSTFSIDVDTGSYANVRRYLTSGQLPPQEAVRVEEMINYFSYDYPTPEDTGVPFSLTTEIGPNPWNDKTKLLHVGIKGYEKSDLEKMPANLVFLVDVSGSMNDQNKLPLLKQSLKMLAQNLSPQDRVSIVTYAGQVAVVLDGASGNDSTAIKSALERLHSAGSTAGKAGIDLAYQTAQKHFIDDGINRVLLATDGDFNVGVSNTDELKKIIERKRDKGISLTTLGFGTGNYNDHLMEQLADTGNGNYAYIDNILEAQKVLITEGQSTLETIAKDVKIQMEFNPSVVSEYRLIGYENRALKREDFDNDKVDAGEIGAGHTVTAIYEIALVGEGGERVAPLRYGAEKSQHQALEIADLDHELGFLKLRYKAPRGLISKLIEVPMDRGQIIDNLDQTSENYRFSAAVAAFGQSLRGGKYLNGFSYNQILELARGARGIDPYGYRAEFMQLILLGNL